MIGAVAPGRLRSMCAVVAVAGLLFSLFALCCCVDGDAPAAVLGAGDSVGVAAPAVTQGGVIDVAGHVDPDCDRSTFAEAAMAASSTGMAVVAIPATRAIVETAPAPGPAPSVRLMAPVPHLLCVMRT